MRLRLPVRRHGSRKGAIGAQLWRFVCGWMQQQGAPREGTSLAVRLMRRPIGTVKRRVPCAARSQRRSAPLREVLSNLEGLSWELELRA